MVRLEAPRDDVRIDELVTFDSVDALEPDGERLQPFLTAAREQRDDERGVEAAGKKNACRHVGDLPALHGARECREQFLAPLAFTAARVGVASRAHSDIPIGRFVQRTVCLEIGARRRRQLLHVAQNGAGRGHHRVQAHVEVHARGVELVRYVARGEKGRQSRREPETARVLRVVERLDAETVAR